MNNPKHRKTRKVDRSKHHEIAKMYSVDLVPMAQIADQFGVSRMVVWKILQSLEVDTTKSGAGNIKCTCNWCGVEIIKKRSDCRRKNHVYCSKKCYFEWLNRGELPFIPSRNSLRIARKLITNYFNLKPQHVVHHRDRNQLNNNISNLMVFKSNSDHISYHRDGSGQPIFDGSKIAI